nr:hypothetical protein [Mycetohabitans sp.]
MCEFYWHPAALINSRHFCKKYCSNILLKIKIQMVYGINFDVHSLGCPLTPVRLHLFMHFIL